MRKEQLPVIVLVAPQHSGNIGMVARAMANFGAKTLRLVDPAPHLNLEARKFALHALPILEEATLYSDLSSALADLHLTIATTRRMGEHRDVPLILTDLPEMLRTLPADSRSGIVFGREDIGLTSAEVSLCSLAATIPTDPGFASLNLAQAVGITLYELSRGTSTPVHPPLPTAESHPPTQGELETLFAQMAQTLGRIGFFNAERPELRMNRLRRIHRKADLDRGELNLLRSMWDQLDWSVRDWSGRKKSERPTGEGVGGFRKGED